MITTQVDDCDEIRLLISSFSRFQPRLKLSVVIDFQSTFAPKLVSDLVNPFVRHPLGANDYGTSRMPVER
jgi:hypothetical protein